MQTNSNELTIDDFFALFDGFDEGFIQAVTQREIDAKENKSVGEFVEPLDL